MNFLCTYKKNAQELQRALITEGIISRDVKPQQHGDRVCFPIIDNADLTILSKYNINNVKKEMHRAVKTAKIRHYSDLLKSELSDEQVKSLPKSYDVVGSVAIIEISDEIDAKKVGSAILCVSKNVKTVLLKKSERSTDFRLYELELIAGEAQSETIHKESGFLFKLDPKFVYFSPREGTERERIASFVQSNEKILVMFAGVGPYAFYCAKRTNNEIYAVEMNPKAVEYLRENILLNKSENIIPIEGDAKTFCIEHLNTFDRIFMPLPRKAEEFLSSAFDSCKNNGVIHFYSWGVEPDVFEDPIKRIENHIKGSYKIIKMQKVLPYAPKVYKVRIDIQKIQ